MSAKDELFEYLYQNPRNERMVNFRFDGPESREEVYARVLEEVRNEDRSRDVADRGRA